MYDNQESTDDLFYYLIDDKTIYSSKQAEEIRSSLVGVGALPKIDGNYNWAMLCIGYCFVKGIAYKRSELIASPDTKGKEIPSFKTCFQKEYQLWFALLSECLFEFYPTKKISKPMLYDYIQTLWHTGAVKLWDLWERCEMFAPESELRQRQKFLQELSELAKDNIKDEIDLGIVQNISYSISGNQLNENTEQSEGLKSALLDLPSVDLKSLAFLYSGVRYDMYRVQLNGFADLEKQKKVLCSAMGKSENAIVIDASNNGEKFSYDIKLLRGKNAWKSLDHRAFEQSMTEFDNHNLLLPICVGVDEKGKAVFKDVAKAPHIMVGGTTGSGKSACMRMMLHSLFILNNQQDKIKIAILDPKKVDYGEFVDYNSLYHQDIITNNDEMFDFLQSMVDEMDERYDLMKTVGAKDLSVLRQTNPKPYMIVVVDELADLLMINNKIESLLIRLAQKGRASGIHLLLSTQRPDAKTFSGLLRSNIPARIALRVNTQTESRIILDKSGAEELIGDGDHLVSWGDGDLIFLHGYNM